MCKAQWWLHIFKDEDFSYAAPGEMGGSVRTVLCAGGCAGMVAGVTHLI